MGLTSAADSSEIVTIQHGHHGWRQDVVPLQAPRIRLPCTSAGLAHQQRLTGEIGG